MWHCAWGGGSHHTHSLFLLKVSTHGQGPLFQTSHCIRTHSLPSDPRLSCWLRFCRWDNARRSSSRIAVVPICPASLPFWFGNWTLVLLWGTPCSPLSVWGSRWADSRPLMPRADMWPGLTLENAYSPGHRDWLRDWHVTRSGQSEPISGLLQELLEKRWAFRRGCQAGGCTPGTVEAFWQEYGDAFWEWANTEVDKDQRWAETNSWLCYEHPDPFMAEGTSLSWVSSICNQRGPCPLSPVPSSPPEAPRCVRIPLMGWLQVLFTGS